MLPGADPAHHQLSARCLALRAQRPPIREGSSFPSYSRKERRRLDRCDLPAFSDSLDPASDLLAPSLGRPAAARRTDLKQPVELQVVGFAVGCLLNHIYG